MNFSVIFSNIIGFDGLIFILAAVNAVIFVSAKKAVDRLYGSMHRQVYTPCARDDIGEIDRDLSALSVRRVSAMREQAESRYTLYVNITGLFPLLGILGTVISLLGMVGSPDSVTNGFFAALTSTFWGLVAAIAFKFSDGFISARLDDSARAAELYISRALEESRTSAAEDIPGGQGVNDKSPDDKPHEKKRVDGKDIPPEKRDKNNVNKSVSRKRTRGADKADESAAGTEKQGEKGSGSPRQETAGDSRKSAREALK